MVVARQMIRQMIKPVDRQLVRSSGKVSTLDIRASVGTSTSPTSTGTKAVTGVGFTPKVVLDFGGAQSAPGAANDYLALGFGAMATDSAGIGVYSGSGVTTSATNRRHSNAGAAQLIFLSALFNSATKQSFDSDGFTRNWTTADSTARILNHICLGGADLEVSLTQHQMSNSNSPQSFAHGLSGAPTGVLFFSSFDGSAPPSTITGIQSAIGAWAGGNQFAAAIVSRNGQTTTGTRRVLSTAAVLSYPWVDGSNNKVMNVGSVTSTNVNVTYTNGDGTSHYFWMLAIRGAKCQVGTFDVSGLTPLTIATTGITPKLFLPVFIPGATGSVLNDLIMSIGACDGTNNISCGITDANAQTTTNARRFQSSTSLCDYFVGGTKAFEGTAAFSGESVVITPTVSNDTNFGQGAYLILGS